MKRIIASILVLLILTGCQSKNTDQTTYKIVLDWTPNTNHTGLYVAVDLGYFEKEGVSVEVVQPPEGSTTNLVGTGKGDAVFGISFQDSLAAAFAKKGDAAIPVSAIAALIQHNTSGILSLKEKGITRPALLGNHSYGTWQSPIELAIIEKIINDDGGNFKDLTLIPNEVTDSITALKTDFDSVWVYYAWDGIAAKVKGLQTNYLNFADYDPALDYYSPVLIANNDFLKNKPDVAKRVVKAVEKGYRYAIENPEKAADILLKHAPELDKTLVVESQKWLKDQYMADVKTWGYIEPQRWNGFYTWLNQNNLVENPIPNDYGFTNAFLSQN